jgi:hypothetical protein
VSRKQLGGCGLTILENSGVWTPAILETVNKAVIISEKQFSRG